MIFYFLLGEIDFKFNLSLSIPFQFDVDVQAQDSGQHPVSMYEAVEFIRAESSGSLQDYRIYGSTALNDPEDPADVSGVGEYDAELNGYKIPVLTTPISENLFDETTANIQSGCWIRGNGAIVSPSNEWCLTDYIPLPGVNKVILENILGGREPGICLYDANKNYLTGKVYGVERYRNIELATETPAYFVRFSVLKKDQEKYHQDYDAIRLYVPSEPVETSVFIGSEPLYADEYVSFSEQKIYRKVNGVLTPTDPPVPLPAIPFYSGLNALAVETTVRPSDMAVKGSFETSDLSGLEYTFFHNALAYLEYAATENTKIEATVLLRSNSPYACSCFGTPPFGFYLYAMYYKYWEINSGHSSTSLDGSDYTDTETPVTVILERTLLTVKDAATQETLFTKELNFGNTYYANSTLGLGGYNSSTSDSFGFMNYGHFRLYDFKIFEGDELAMHLVPVRDSRDGGVIRLQDVVTGIAYYASIDSIYNVLLDTDEDWQNN